MPAPQDEQLWRQLYGRLELQAQAQQMLRERQQQQQQHPGAQQPGGVGLLGGLLSDLLLRPAGTLLVPESDSDLSDSGGDEAPEVNEQAAPAAAGGAPQLPHHQQQQRQACQAGAMHSSSSKQEKLRHGWGWYWMWLRRALLAKALLSLAVSGLGSWDALEQDSWPQPLPARLM